MLNSAPPRLIFAGTPEFAVPTLQALLSMNAVHAVYTQPDRPAGRGRQIRFSPVKQVAENAGIPIYQPSTLRTPETQQELRKLAPDLMIVVAYGLLLPQAVLDIPRLGCVNVHASLLPRWRGAAPIQRAIQAGDIETGVTLMQMEAGLDTGPILAQSHLPIGNSMNAAQLHDTLSILGAETLEKHLPALLNKHLIPRAQDERLACYAEKLSKQEAQLDWHKPAQQLEWQVRAFNPWPVAQTSWHGKILRIWQAKALPHNDEPSGEGSFPPGHVIAADHNGIRVATGDGILQLLQIQIAGKRAQVAADFINAHRVQGQQFGL